MQPCKNCAFCIFQKSTFNEQSFRVYYKLKQWFGNVKNVTQWGWKLSAGGLVLVFSSEPLIPENLLKTITFTCENGCKGVICECRKHGLRCSHLCVNCHGEARTNIDMSIITKCNWWKRRRISDCDKEA